MSLRHLFRKKVNMNLCFGVKEHYGRHECKYLKRVFLNAGLSRELLCTCQDRFLKHSPKIKQCQFYKEGK